MTCTAILMCLVFAMKRCKMSELRHQEIIDRVHYMYLQTDGTIEFPNSFEGDLLKIAYGIAVQSIKQPQLNPNQQIVLDWLKKEKIKRSTLDILIIRELAELIYHGYFSEELVYKAFMEINRKQQAQVLQAFIRWAIEQEEG